MKHHTSLDLLVYYVASDGTYISLEDLFVNIDGSHKYHYDARGKKIMSFLTRFITNFLMFINNPDVEVVSRRRSAKSMSRRAKQGKFPVRETNRIILRGRIKRYVERFGGELLSSSFDHRFWVRGHWRTFRASRYRERQGVSIWIEPYIKGRGDMREKSYSLVSDVAASRRLRKDFLFLDDFPVRSSSLRDSRRSKK
jgi:hypothetical protein